VDTIKAVLFEPVGCLAEFRADEFNKASVELLAPTPDAAASGSHAYWRLLGLLAPRWGTLSQAEWERLRGFELEACEHADLYPDVRACLEELKQIGVAAYIVSSLSRAAVDRFIVRFSLADLLAGVIAREDAQGVMEAPLRHAIAQTKLDPGRLMVLVETAEAITVANSLRLNAMLMINDYDEGRLLAERSPAGGLVSLAELPDALRLIEQRAGLTAQARLPQQPFELFDPT
jgi:phosphoglycolate phosphatase-like HAD superfamily hydrolase